MISLAFCDVKSLNMMNIIAMRKRGDCDIASWTSRMGQGVGLSKCCDDHHHTTALSLEFKGGLMSSIRKSGVTASCFLCVALNSNFKTVLAS